MSALDYGTVIKGRDGGKQLSEQGFQEQVGLWAVPTVLSQEPGWFQPSAWELDMSRVEFPPLRQVAVAFRTQRPAK